MVSTKKIPSELAEMFPDPLKCDVDGNLYIRLYSGGISGIHKLNQKGERVAVFEARSPTADLKVDFGHYFSIAPNGDVYQLIFAHEITRYVFVYKSDGTYKATIKLQPGFAWNPAQVAPFPSGNILVTGLEYDKDPNAALWPFTGIFSSDGSLLKEVKLEDDDKIRDMAAAGDAGVTSPEAPGTNFAIGRGAMEAAEDGNVYLMRRLRIPIIYAISPGGEVVRRFSVHVNDSSYMPNEMHIAGNRIAVQFLDSITGSQMVEVVDLEGNEIATYKESEKSGNETLGSAFACYSINPERFAYLGTTDDAILTFKIGEPR